MALSLAVVCLLLLASHAADGYMFHMDALCAFNSTELNDIEFIEAYFYNKVELLRFTSTSGKFVGYTEFGIKQADYLNSDKDLINSLKARKEAYCAHNVQNEYQAALTKSAKPYVRLHRESSPDDGGGSAGILVCTVYDFYPKRVRVTWLRDEREVTSDVTSTDELPDGDWYYQLHSHLLYAPKSGEKIACVVEHAGLHRPLRVDWDPSLSKSEKNKLAIGASGLTLGLVLSLGGFVYYRKKRHGRVLVPSN